MGNGLLENGIIRLSRCKRYKRAFERRVADRSKAERVVRQKANVSSRLRGKFLVYRNGICPLTRDGLLRREDTIFVSLRNACVESIIEDDATAGERHSFRCGTICVRRHIGDVNSGTRSPDCRKAFNGGEM